MTISAVVRTQASTVFRGPFRALERAPEGQTALNCWARRPHSTAKCDSSTGTGADSVEVLFAAFGSVTPAGAETEAVLTTEPAAPVATSHVNV